MNSFVIHESALRIVLGGLGFLDRPSHGNRLSKAIDPK
jgi:hypothetical protein